jgi:hypothetical protein
MKIVADEASETYLRDNGGKLWIWLDGHIAFGGVQPIYLATAIEFPGTTRATRRMRSARRPHRFTPVDGDGYELLLDIGTFEMPDELHLVYKRWPKPHVDAYWNGAIFVGDDIPPMGER